jgi:hypothetical protein
VGAVMREYGTLRMVGGLMQGLGALLPLASIAAFIIGVTGNSPADEIIIAVALLVSGAVLYGFGGLIMVQTDNARHMSRMLRIIEAQARMQAESTRRERYVDMERRQALRTERRRQRQQAAADGSGEAHIGEG